MSSSLPVSLLEQASAMARKQQPIQQQQPTKDITKQRGTLQLQSTHHQRSILQLRSIHQPSTLQPSILQPSTIQPSTLQPHLIMEDITSHFVDASTPSLGNPMHTGD